MKFALFGKYIEVYPDTLEPIAHPDMSLAGDFDWSGTPMKSRRPPGSTEIVATRPVNHRARYATVTDFADSQRLEVYSTHYYPHTARRAVRSHLRDHNGTMRNPVRWWLAEVDATTASSIDEVVMLRFIGGPVTRWTYHESR